ncbi:tyrosine-type recombinase/integrase [Clostridium oryzae]|uniref:Tyrosine recombinase XerC n=1 Tax=Clostridium oryzae TaxID=1450648 RepID=A0A1V4IKZ5_9CLOT|nr:tyrosine-type recombinase/integrase [Clostridium oryzae]OPJ60573.1 tyrosine recombinase XerC [Clostridium oryzae]
MKSSTPSFQTLLQNFFLQRLMQQRKVSGETVSSYRDTFRVYLHFLSEIYHISAVSAELEHFGLDYLQEFCKCLENTRRNKAVTINNRLAAIRAFLKYVAEMEPEYSGLIKRSLMIPFQKHKVPTMDFITKSEFNAMLATCDTKSSLGARDKLMLMILYNSGVRVSELLSIRYSDLKDANTTSRTCVKIHGKGRKERIVPLWKTTAQYIQKYVADNGIKNDDFLFINKNGLNLTRSGIRFRIDKIVQEAAISEPALAEKKITPHTFRHSVAMNLLAVGVDISTIAIWLGHSSIETTHKYMAADIEMKRNAMERAGSSGNSAYNYKPSSDILNFLNTL